MSTSVPQVRALSELEHEMEGPAQKKPRLDNDVSHTPVGAESTPAEDAAMDVEPPTEEILDEASLNQKPTGISKKKNKQKKKKEPPLPEPCSPGDVLYREIRELLGEDAVDEVTAAGNAFKAPFEKGDEVVVKILMIGSGGTFFPLLFYNTHTHTFGFLIGSGIALAPPEKGPWAIVVPCALTGETVRVRIGKWERMHSCAQLLEVLEPNTELRDDSRVQCKYFGTCGGCQYQVRPLWCPRRRF